MRPSRQEKESISLHSAFAAWERIIFHNSFFQNHPWFSGVDWTSITSQSAPYVPEVSSPTDTSNFDVDDNDLRQCDTQPPQHNTAFSGLHLPFAGFSFTLGVASSSVASPRSSGRA